MGYENSSEIANNSFSFLSDSFVGEHFADLNLTLLGGGHVQQDDGPLFQLLDEYSEHFRHYYEALYGLSLDENTIDNFHYYYLVSPEDSRTKMSSTGRCRELTQTETIIGMMLLNMYYDRYFEEIKEIHWSAIRTEILEGKNSDLYKKSFFGDVRENYTRKEWSIRKKNFNSATKFFEKLGWIRRITPQGVIHKGDTHFVLLPSIHRLATLYEAELDKFDDFVESYHQSKKS